MYVGCALPQGACSVPRHAPLAARLGRGYCREYNVARRWRSFQDVRKATCSSESDVLQAFLQVELEPTDEERFC